MIKHAYVPIKCIKRLKKIKSEKFEFNHRHSLYKVNIVVQERYNHVILLILHIA